MKNSLCFLAVCLFFPASGLCAATDCGKSPDACRPEPVNLTPFMAEFKKADRPRELNRRPAEHTEAETATPVPAPMAPAPESSTSAPVSVTPGETQPQKEVFSRPGWLFAAALFLYGLYSFLKSRKKGKRYK